MKQYKAIWFDDQHETFETIKDDAKQHGISLIGFTNAEDGLNSLELNLFSYDAVIVDGKFYKSSRATGDTVDDSALFNVARFLDKVEDQKKIPWFIFSGQPDFINEANRIAVEYKNNKVYNKNFDKDIEQLWADIITEADQQTDTQIRHKFERVFEVCSSKYIGDQANKYLLAILKKENSDNVFADPDLYFNPLRKIMEDLFIAFNKYNLLPDVFIKPSVALNESSKFLFGGIEKGYQHAIPVFPKVISDYVRSILAVCQTASHRAEIDTFITQVNSPYLLLSITYQLLDVLLWFKSFVDANNDLTKNKARFKQVVPTDSSAIINAVIEKDEKGNYHCGDILITYKLINSNEHKVGDEIRILKSVTNTNEKTMHLYSKSALQTEKI